MQAALESPLRGVVDEAVALDAALAGEGFRHDIKTEMGFAALPPAGMAAMLFRFVGDGQVGSVAGSPASLCDPIG